MKTIQELIQVTDKGITKEDYRTIVQTLYSEYRKIYGYDIELDPRSADGRFIYDVATIIDSGLTAIVRMYSFLDPSTATGAYLDMLCSLTNVERRPATHSYARVKFTNQSNSDVVLTVDNSTLIDDSGSHEWNIVSQENEYSMTPYLSDGSSVTVPADSSEEFVYQCTDTGKISTSSFTFMVAESDTSNLSVSVEAVAVGEDEESDSDLRMRRANDSVYGVTILEALQGSMKRILGVDDCIVNSYSGNPDENSWFWLNNEKVPMTQHSAAVVIRENAVNKPKDSDIADTIRSMLTPGVSTYQPSAKSMKKYSYVNSGINTISTFYWLVCSAVHPDIEVALNAYDSFAGKSAALQIANQLTNYLGNLAISYRYTEYDLRNTIQSADPLYMSQSTYAVFSVDGLGTDLSVEENHMNKGCYFDYSGYSIEKVGSDWSHFRITVK